MSTFPIKMAMETLSCHSNKSSWTLKIKIITFVEGNVITKYAKFQLCPPYCFREDFLNIYFENLPFIATCDVNQSN